MQLLVHSVSVVNGIVRILPVVCIRFSLLLNELRGQTELIEWDVLQAEFRGSLTAILVLKYLVWRSGIEAGAR